MKKLTENEHVQIRLIQAGFGNRQKLADMIGVQRQAIYNCTHGRRTRWIRQRIFEILRERLPDEVKQYSDVWIDEPRQGVVDKQNEADKDAA